MRQSDLSSWRCPSDYQGRTTLGPQPQGGPPKRPVRGRQSRATDHPTVAQWNAECRRREEQETWTSGISLQKQDRHHLHSRKTPKDSLYAVTNSSAKTDQTGTKGASSHLLKHQSPVEVCTSGESDLEHITVKALLTEGNVYITNCYRPSASMLELRRMTSVSYSFIIWGSAEKKGHSAKFRGHFKSNTTICIYILGIPKWFFDSIVQF